MSKAPTSSELKASIESTGKNLHYFDRKTMRCFGDTMRNYGVRGPVTVRAYYGNVECWELYRRKPVKYGNKQSAYWACGDFRRVFGEVRA